MLFRRTHAVWVLFVAGGDALKRRDGRTGTTVPNRFIIEYAGVISIFLDTKLILHYSLCHAG